MNCSRGGVLSYLFFKKNGNAGCWCLLPCLVQLCQIMLRYSLRVLYILSTGCLQANWWVVVQDFKQNKQIKRESWCVEWYFYYLVFYFLSIRKIIQSLTKSPIYFKEEKLNFTCWLQNHDPKLALARILPLFFCLLERLEVFSCFH